MGLNIRRKFSDDDKIKILQEGMVNGVPQTFRISLISLFTLRYPLFFDIFFRLSYTLSLLTLKLKVCFMFLIILISLIINIFYLIS